MPPSAGTCRHHTPAFRSGALAERDLICSSSVRLPVCAIALASCTGAATLAIDGDRPIPMSMTSLCVGVGDTAASGGTFGSDYELTGKLAQLPQTLRIEPGGASAAYAWLRADRAGVMVTETGAGVDFGGQTTLLLDTCADGPAALPHSVGDPVGPGSALLAASIGDGGVIVLALGQTSAAAITSHGSSLVAGALPALPTGKPVAVAAIDVDGDCDDDAIVLTDSAAPAIWIRDHATFHDSGMALGTAPAAAIAVGDVDGDGDLDVITGAGSSVTLWRNNGAGQFTADTSGALVASKLTSITALALADVDGNGYPDLVVGQAGSALAAWLNNQGQFTANAAVVPPLPLDVERLTLVDANGDYQPDLEVAVNGSAMHLLVDRDGLLEDQSFDLLPAPIPVAHAIAIGGWNNVCAPDAVIASASGTPTWTGKVGGGFAAEASTAPAATDVVMTDINSDGLLDALLATPTGVAWLAR